ncbi:hypothetical protein [Dietzia lutea]|uniref:Uncharacterized protein n=1 Tax=Dietzia lutea TaxID=546160 RepID=A0A2S1RA40_9ACTN|nr:hypothetical protein [Dietzia lutea]AWH93158.1 hypothetical protein A6035_14330 [Dietzia lutea]
MIATTGVASAQIPGQNVPAQVFPVDDTSIQLAVNEPNIETGAVSITIQNNTANALTCTGIGGGPAATVTRDEIVALGVDHWARYPYAPFQDLEIDLQLPSSGSISLPIPDLPDQMDVDLGSVTGLLPGSLGELFWPEIGNAAEIGTAYGQARRAGQVAVLGDSFTVPANTARTVTGELGVLSQGERQDFSAGAIATCVVDGQRYIFAGYENGRPDIGGGSSSGSLNAGSLGS